MGEFREEPGKLDFNRPREAKFKKEKVFSKLQYCQGVSWLVGLKKEVGFVTQAMMFTSKAKKSLDFQK